MELFPHQLEVANNLGNGKVLWGEVGTGKSVAVMAYYMKAEAPADIYVITTAKKRDTLEWLGDAALFGIGTEEGMTVAGVLTIDSWNNLSKYEKIEDAFFIFDEQRLVGTGSWVRSFLKIARKNRWVLLTATPGDNWLDYAPLFVANGLYSTISQFKREHVVYAPYVKFPKVVRYTGVDTLERYRNMLLVEMEYFKHTKRYLEWVHVEHDKEAFELAWKHRWNTIDERPIKDVGELFRTVRKIVNTDESRMNEIHKLLEDHPKIIIFYNFDYELYLLRELEERVEVFEWNGHRKHPVPKSDNWVYLVQYQAGAEGWNCTETDTVIFYSLTYSYKTFLQAQGRIDRLNTPFKNLMYYVLISDSLIDSAIRRCLEGKRIFNEQAFYKTKEVEHDSWEEDFR